MLLHLVIQSLSNWIVLITQFSSCCISSLGPAIIWLRTRYPDSLVGGVHKSIPVWTHIFLGNCQQKKKPECIICNLFLEVFLINNPHSKGPLSSVYHPKWTSWSFFTLLDTASNFLAVFLQQDILEAEVFMAIVTGKKSCKKMILYIFQDI